MERIDIEDRKLILQKWCTGQFSLRKIANEVKCSKSAVFQIIKKFGEHHTLDNLPKSRRRTDPANPNVEEKVVRLLKAKKYMSVREIAKKEGISVGTVQNIKKRNIVRTYKKQKMPKRSAEQQIRSKKRCRNLYDILLQNKSRFILMDDETYVKFDTSTLPGPQYYNAVVGEIVPDSEKAIKMDKFGKKVLVWQAICSCGLKSTSYFAIGTISGEIYRKECITKRLLPIYRQHSIPPLF